MRRRVVPALIGLLAAALAAWRRRVGRAERARLAEEPASAALAQPPRQLAAAPAHEPAGVSEPESAAHEPAAEERVTVEPTTPPAGAPPPPGPRFVSIPWTLATADGDEGAARDLDELPIRFTLLGERMDLDRVDVRETESQVFVTVLARFEPPEPSRPWAPYGVAREARVRLARPLGDRALVHAPDQLDELTGGDGPGGGA